MSNNNSNNNNNQNSKTMTDAFLMVSPWDNAVTFSSGFLKTDRFESAPVRSLNLQNFQSNSNKNPKALRSQSEATYFNNNNNPHFAHSQHSNVTRGACVDFVANTKSFGMFTNGSVSTSSNSSSSFESSYGGVVEDPALSGNKKHNINNVSFASGVIPNYSKSVDSGLKPFGKTHTVTVTEIEIEAKKNFGQFTQDFDKLGIEATDLDHIDLFDFDAFEPKVKVPSHTLTQTQAIATAKLLSNTDINVNEDFDADDDIDMDQLFVPSKLLKGVSNNINENDWIMTDSIRGKDGCFLKPKYYNEFTSCLTEDSPQIVLKTLERLLLNEYNKSLKFDCDREVNVRNINERDYSIEGTAYIKHRPIKFMIFIWHETQESGQNGNDYLTRIEFQKQRGDSFVFEQFWCEMLELMFTSFHNVTGANRCPDFESFFMPCSSLSLSSLSVSNWSDSDSESDFEYKRKDLDEMAMDLKQDYREEAIEIMAGICEKMQLNNSFAKMVSEHDILVTILIQMLTHFDVSHIRAALCVLIIIIDICVSSREQVKIGNNINEMKGSKEFEKKVAKKEEEKIMKWKGLMLWKLLVQLMKLYKHENEMIRMRTFQLIQKLAYLAKFEKNEWNLVKMGNVEKDQINAWMIEFAHDTTLVTMLNCIKSRINSL